MNPTSDTIQIEQGIDLLPKVETNLPAVQDFPVIEIYARPGMTIKEVLEASLPSSLQGHSNVLVYNKGVQIRNPELYYFNEGDLLSVYLVPEGGGGGGRAKGGIKGALQIIVGVLIVIFSFGTLAPLGVGLILGGIGTLVSSLISPPPSLNTNDAKSGDTSRFLITGQSNSARFYSPVLKLYGRHKMFPAVVTLPRIDNVGIRSDINALYDWGMGEVHIANLKIGETPIATYTSDVINHINTQDPPLRWVGYKAHQDSLALVTENGKAHFLRTVENTIGADIDISFLYGLIGTNDKGEDQPAAANYVIRYREILTGGTEPGTPGVNFPPGRADILMGETLFMGDTRTSPNQWYRLAMQGDGNLVLYAKNGMAVWSTITDGNPGARFVYGGTPAGFNPIAPNFPAGATTVLVGDTLLSGSELVSPNGWYKAAMQSDGNFVLYAKNGTVRWNTGTQGNPGSRFVYSPSTIIGLPVAPAPDFPLVGGDVINMGDTLNPGDVRTSSNGWFKLIMQADGNLVIYGKNQVPIWSTKTAAHSGARFVYFPTGVLAVLTPTNKVAWKRGPFHGTLRIQTDGNLVLTGTDGRVKWSSGVVSDSEPGNPIIPPQPPAPDIPNGVSDTITMGTTLFPGHQIVSSNGWFRLIVQEDGNCVVYSKDGTVCWQTRTAGERLARLVYDNSGYFRLYSPTNAVLWGVGPFPGTVKLQDDGNLVLTDTSGKVRWHSGVPAAGGPPAPVPQPPPSVPDIPTTVSDTVQMTETMHAGDSRVSPNGWYSLNMQGDGNLVLYRKNGDVIWASKTSVPGSRFVYFATGVFAVISPSNQTLWKSDKPYQGRLVVQSDGNFVCYNAAGTAVWSTKTASSIEPGLPPQPIPPSAPPAIPAPTPTPPSAPPNIPLGKSYLDALETLPAGGQLVSPSGWCRLVMQTDGNLVLYSKTDRVIWHTDTRGNPESRLVYDHEGNLRVYTPQNKILWAVNNLPGGRLNLQDDGNLVLYRGSDVLWNSGTASPGEPRALGTRADPPQVDYGGLYVYSPDNVVLWHVPIADGRMVIQDDGNLVVYAATGAPIWSSQSADQTEPTFSQIYPQEEDGTIKVYTPSNQVVWDGGKYIGRMLVQDDGNLVIYDAANTALWNIGAQGNDEPSYIESRGHWIPVGPGAVTGVNKGYALGVAPTFNAAWYVRTYPDVANSDEWRSNPYKHYMEIGRFKGYLAGPPPSGIRMWSQSRKPLVASVHIDFPYASQWEIEVRRSSNVADGSKEVNAATITMLESQIPGPVVKLTYPHTFTEMKVRASGKLSGVVQNLSAIATSVLNIYDDKGARVGKNLSRNPAWICIDILTGSSNPRPVPWNMIDWPAWKRLADYCDEERTWVINGKSITSKRHTCDVVVDYLTTVRELIFSILSGCRSALIIGLDGKYSVAIDSQKSTPRQLITTANSWDFSGTRQFGNEIHGVRVSFLDSRSDYQKQEITAYADGYNEGNATKLEELGTFGITDFWQAWAFGRYHLACALHRSEIFSMMMDVENLAFSRGDLVAVAHDVPQVGGMPCKVVEVNGNTVTIHEAISVEANGYTVRLQDGTIRQGNVTGRPDAYSFSIDNATGINADDLIVFGDPHKVTKHYLVQSIAPRADLTAEVTLVPYVPELYDADIGTVPPWDAGITGDYINKTDLKALNLKVVETLVYKDRVPYAKLAFTWDVSGLGYGYGELYMTTQKDMEIHIGTSDANTRYFEYFINTLTQRDLINVDLLFEIVPITASGLGGASDDVVLPHLRSTSAVTANFTGGLAGASAYVNYIPTSDDNQVRPPENFSVNVQDMLIELRWEPSPDIDISFYEIRYSPDPFTGDWAHSQFVAKLPWDVHKTSAGARTGRYMIQAVDTSGNRSTVVWQRTTVETLPNVNQVKDVNDKVTGWQGALSHLVRGPFGLELAGGFGNVVPEGYYYFKDIVTFDSVYEVRVSSKIVGYGLFIDDIMKNWTPLASARPLARANSANFAVELQYRTSNNTRVMRDWVPISTQVPLNMGSGDWSEWRTVTVSDVTARYIQFRIKVTSRDKNLRVILTDGHVEIDASDWIFRQNDLSIPLAGYDVVYSPPFMDKPVVAVSIDGTTTALSYKATKQTRMGCHIQLLDEHNHPVAGKVDVSALGQGRQRTTSI